MASFLPIRLIRLRSILATSTTAAIGIAHRFPFIRTIITSIIAIVGGRTRVNVDPFPSSVSTLIFPFKDSMALFTTSSPTPLPLISVIFSAVEKPG